MRRASFIPLVIAIAALTAMPPAAAGTARIPYRCEFQLVEVTDGGTAWVEDGSLHVRGWTGVYDVVGEDQCAGVGTAVANFNLDLATWSGGLWGTQMVALDAFNGGYAGTFTARWTADDPLAPDAEDIWVGRYTYGGFGDLEGWQARGNIVETTHLLVIDEGYAFLPGS